MIAASEPITYFQAIVLGLLQGVSELFPISSLGHSVIFPSLFGWNIHQNDKYFLTFLVATHLATAIVLFGFFWHDWMRILRGLGRSLRDRQVAPDDADARLAWLLVVGTIPAGIIGLLFEHQLRSLFANPTAAAVFLMINGLILFAAERLRRRAPGAPERAEELARQEESSTGPEAEKRLATLGYREAVAVGTAQAAALFPGISRSGVTMVGGLLRGLNHEDAARFAFLLATPVILAAGVYKVPDLAGPLGNGVRGQALAGGIAAFVAAYIAVRFLERFFEHRTLTPFAIYSLVVGGLSLVHFA